MSNLILMLFALWIVGIGIWFEIGMLRRLFKRLYFNDE